MPQKAFFSLRDKAALITGGTDGIGLAVAKRFVKAGTQDVEGLYHFLASDESRYITGQAIMVDGGVSAGLSVDALVRLMSG